MSQSLTIKVERQDIEGGLPDEGYACPIALAAMRACPWDNPDPYVGQDFIRIKDEDGHRIQRDLPAEAQAFILDFDDEMGEFGGGEEGKFDPFEFEVSL